MNILMLANSFPQPDDRDSGETPIVLYFAKEWESLNHRVIIIHNSSRFFYLLYRLPGFVYNLLRKKTNVGIPSIASRRTLRRKDGDVLIVRLPIFRLYPGAPFAKWQYNKQVKRIEKILMEEQFLPDVITGHWLVPQVGLIARLQKDYPKARTGIVLHGSFPKKISQFNGNNLEAVDRIFFRSAYMKRVGSENLSELSDKMSICYSGVPDSFVQEEVVRTDWKTSGVMKVLYVGRLITYKRIDAVLDALTSTFPKRDFVFDIVGDGVLEEPLRKQSERLGIQDHVVFHGRVDRDKVMEFMGSADCFVMISEKETFGLVYLEAMAKGAITIAAYDGGVDGIIKNGINGFLCEEGNSKELSKLLSKINLLPIDELNTIRTNALETVKQFTDSKVADSYLRDLVGPR